MINNDTTTVAIRAYCKRLQAMIWRYGLPVPVFSRLCTTAVQHGSPFVRNTYIYITFIVRLLMSACGKALGRTIRALIPTMTGVIHQLVVLRQLLLLYGEH